MRCDEQRKTDRTEKTSFIFESCYKDEELTERDALSKGKQQEQKRLRSSSKAVKNTVPTKDKELTEQDAKRAIDIVGSMRTMRLFQGIDSAISTLG